MKHVYVIKYFFPAIMHIVCSINKIKTDLIFVWNINIISLCFGNW